VVGIARQVQRNEEMIAVQQAEMVCDRTPGCGGADFNEYFAIRQRIGEREKALARQNVAARRAAAVDSLARLRVGDVIRVPGGRRAGLAVVLDPDVGGPPGRLGAEPRPLVLTEDRWAGRITAGEFGAAVDVLTRVRVPKHFNHRSPQERRDLAAALRQAVAQHGVARRGGRGSRRSGDDSEIVELRRQLRRHPCHACPDREEHARWAERRARLERDTVALREKVATRTGSLTRTFDRICGLLEARGYLSAGQVTETGRMLARIWTEADLLVAECLRRGVWNDLDPSELAAAVSIVVFESRRDSDENAAVPRGPVADAIDATVKLWSEVEAAEAQRGLELTREPDLGFVWPMYRWARGETLSRVLASAAEADMPAGDFVRWARQVVDLLGQIADASGVPKTVRTTARAAMQAVTRGVLAQTSVG